MSRELGDQLVPKPGWWARKPPGKKAIWILLAIPLAVLIVAVGVALLAALGGEGLGSLFGGGSGSDRVGSRESGETTRFIRKRVSDLGLSDFLRTGR